MSKKVLAIVFVTILILSLSVVPALAAPYKDIKIGAGKNVIEAEDFDTGDYNETNAADGNHDARPDEGIQTEVCANDRDDAPIDNYDIGWTAGGEWVQFTVNVEKAGTAQFEIWLASGADPKGSVEIFYDGTSVGVGTASNSTDWQDWDIYPVGEIALTEGSHVIKAEFLDGNVNLDAIVITLPEDAAAPPAEEAAETPDAQNDETAAEGETEAATEGTATDSDGNSMVLWIAISVGAVVVIVIIVVLVTKKKK